MKIMLMQDTIRETFGDLYFVGMEQRFVYDNDKRAYTEEVQSTTLHVACDKQENSFDVILESPEIPNVKKFGKMRIDGFAYFPTAGVNSYTRDGQTQNRGAINERFTGISVSPLTPADRKADENGEVINSAKENQNQNKK